MAQELLYWDWTHLTDDLWLWCVVTHAAAWWDDKGVQKDALLGFGVLLNVFPRNHHTSHSCSFQWKWLFRINGLNNWIIESVPYIHRKKKCLLNIKIINNLFRFEGSPLQFTMVNKIFFTFIPRRQMSVVLSLQTCLIFPLSCKIKTSQTV